jgi:hypothetical protein
LLHHPAELNGYRAAAPPLLRLCSSASPAFLTKWSVLGSGVAGRSPNLVVDLEVEEAEGPDRVLLFCSEVYSVKLQDLVVFSFLSRAFL